MNVPPGGPALLKSVTYSLLILALISNALLIIYVNFMYAQLSARADSLRAGMCFSFVLDCFYKIIYGLARRFFKTYISNHF